MGRSFILAIRHLSRVVTTTQRSSGALVSQTQEKHFHTTHGPQTIYKSNCPVDIPQLDFFSYMSKDVNKSNSSKTAIICGISGKKYTYQEVLDLSEKIGKGLLRRGYRKGDMAAIYSPNIPEYFLTILGCAYAGLALTLVNPLNTATEVENQLQSTDTKVLFTFPTFAKNSFQAKVSTPQIRDVFMYGAPYKIVNPVINVYLKLLHGSSSFWPFDELMSAPSKWRWSFMRNPWYAKRPKIDINDKFMILYSSGTSGLPKAAVHSHISFISYVHQLHTYPSARIIDNAGILMVLPLFHIFGCTGHMFCFKQGGFFVTNPLFKKSLFLKSIQNYQLECVLVVPPLVNFLVTDPMVKRYDLGSLTCLICGGAPLAEALAVQCTKTLPKAKIYQGYGMTEGLITLSSGTESLASVGKLVPNVEAKFLTTETREECGTDQVGELLVKTPSALVEYYKNPEATEATFERDENGDKWLLTGDIGYMDADGSLFLVDRLKEMIKYKGHQVSPVEVEQTLLQLTGIVDAAVCGAPHDSFGELPMAFVVKETNSNLTEEDVKKYIKDNMAYMNHLRGGVRFVDEIPKSRIGKILRRKLKELL